MSGETGVVKANSLRLYLVTEHTENGNAYDEKIVEAASQAQAIRLVVGERFKAAPATPRDMQRVLTAQYAKEGGK